MDTPFTAAPRYRRFESAIDLLDPAQHFQGDAPSKKEEKNLVMRAEAEEEVRIKQEGLDTEQKKLEATRKLRKTSAGRKGRRASIMAGALGAKGEPEIRRASLG